MMTGGRRFLPGRFPTLLEVGVGEVPKEVVLYREQEFQTSGFRNLTFRASPSPSGRKDPRAGLPHLKPGEPGLREKVDAQCLLECVTPNQTTHSVL